MGIRKLLPLAGVLLAAAVACSTQFAATSAPARADARGGAPADKVVAQPAPAVPPNAGGQSGGGEPVLGVRFISDRVLVLTANLELKAVDAWRVADLVQNVALGMGGEVTSVSQSGRGEDRSATVTVRVPNERFQDALNQIKSMPDVDVLRVQVTGEDRTEQFIDLDARLKAKQAEEQRYLALLARADKIDDILRIDQVLANVRAQIEQLQGQLNALKSRSSLATITVSVGPLRPVSPLPQTGWKPARTFESAATALAGFLQRAADLAIWLLVWVTLPALGLGLVLALGRLLRPREAKTQS